MQTPGHALCLIAMGMSLLSILALGACGLGGPAYAPVSSDVAATVEVTSDLRYVPAELTVRAGDTVEWRNVSLFGHTVTADPALTSDPARVVLPSGASPFDSGDIPPGGVYHYTFTVPGTYQYFCVPHEARGMLGTVVVKPVD